MLDASTPTTLRGRERLILPRVDEVGYGFQPANVPYPALVEMEKKEKIGQNLRAQSRVLSPQFARFSAKKRQIQTRFAVAL
jgi:hypothetical protein